MSRVLAGVLSVAMGMMPIAPPEHMHEAEDHGQIHAFIHRHLPAHGFLEHHTPHHPATVDDDDGPVLTLSTVYNVPALFVIAAPHRSIETVEPPAPRPLDHRAPDVEILIHGPPRAPNGLRAPPIVPTT